jgi:hypothetical protein
MECSNLLRYCSGCTLQALVPRGFLLPSRSPSPWGNATYQLLLVFFCYTLMIYTVAANYVSYFALPKWPIILFHTALNQIY